MIRRLPRKAKLLMQLLLLAVATMAQQPQNQGIKRGIVKVKFTGTVASTLSTLKVHSTLNGLSTGMPALDRVANDHQATAMTRLFPYDVRHEQKLRRHGLDRWYVFELNESVDPRQVVAQFRKLSEVETAEVEYEKVIAPYQVTPYKAGISTMEALPFNDPMLKDQWHYNNTQQLGSGDADVNLFQAWTTTTGASNIIVSVHDQGVDVNHQDLAPNIWINQSEKDGQPNIDDDGNGYVDDIHGWNFQKGNGRIDPEYHGTHVAGTIAAVNNNGVGVSGIAGGNGTGNGVKIMSLQILGSSAIEKSYVYAANNGAVISQNSWGYTSPYAYDQSVLDAIDYFIEEAGNYPGSPMRGGIVIFAAGNANSNSNWYPAYHPRVLAVASVGPEWVKASYSNYGDWIELAAPGGDQDSFGAKGGVLSTIPKDQYAYMQGTSMACPHVSGVAALAIANRTSQLTADELRNKLITGTINIDQYNPDFVGLLGTGAIDAALAIQNDLGLPPAAITDLTVTGVSQEFATLAWSIPADEDDTRPVSFQLYVHTQPITGSTISQATLIQLGSRSVSGTLFTHEVVNLLGLTTYYFAVTATDRWGNVSGLSNSVEATTNEGPSIAVDENSQTINLTINAADGLTATHNLTILNNTEGLLRWSHLMRHKNQTLAFNTSALRYPVAKAQATEPHVVKVTAQNLPKVKSTPVAPASFQPEEMAYSLYPTNIIGDTDLTLTNSSLAKFSVTQPNGFNLTQARMYLKHDPALGPVILEVYQGETPEKSNLIYAQEYMSFGAYEGWANVTLDEQLFFPSGATFWLAFHVPAGNKFPLGIGFETSPEHSTLCFMSFDMGNTWTSLEQLLESEDFAWSIVAASYNEHLGTYLTLEPGSGEISGIGQASASLTAHASTLSNGEYSANLVLASNDPQQRELRIPVNLSVSGHLPDIHHLDVVDFGSTFVGTEKELDLVLENRGYGNYNSPEFAFGGSQFELIGSAPWQIKAREDVVVKLKFKPTTTGNINDILTITNGSITHQIPLFGIGAETAKIAITPPTQLFNNLAIGDNVKAEITVANTGAYPLKYFIPGFDSKGVSENWPSGYHKYGYKIRSNHPEESDPLNYEFQDISTTGIDITQQLKADDKYVAVDMGFAFPYYGTTQNKIFIAQKGFTAFTDRVRPINTPRLGGGEYSADGYISLLGTYLSYLNQGKIFYQLEADRLIIQYDHVTDDWNGTATAQMVLFANGNIRFYYDELSLPAEYLIVLMEDVAKQDGILVNAYDKPFAMYSGLALGFDYPGPNIISEIANGSGIVMPDSVTTVSVTLNTASLPEGVINRYINFISNDPAQAETYGLLQLEINQGGIAQPLVTIDTIAFKEVFLGASRVVPFVIKNQGTANVSITSMAFVNGYYNLTGVHPVNIEPGLYKDYSVSIPTNTLGNFEDWLSINYADGSHDTIYVTGKVVVPPAIQVDLSLLQESLAFGGKSSHPFVVENSGLANLKVSVTGAQWVSFTGESTPSEHSYSVQKHNDGNFYQWLDIRKSGTQMPFMTFDDFQNTFWRDLDLPFTIQFFGQSYDKLKIGDNGLISFEENPEASLFTDYIPSATHDGPCIMPYWTFSGFSDYVLKKEDIGIFYQFYDDKIVILWSLFVNNFGGMGDPVSAEVIIYKNGTMKFQYKPEGVDLTSHFGTIGLQKDGKTGITISEYQPLIHGKGLAYIIVPTNQLTIAPGTVMNGTINFDASNIYGGDYQTDLLIETNVPNQEHLTKPVELIVSGEAIVETATEIDFGTKVVTVDELGSPVLSYQPFTISDTGAAALEITWMQMADAQQGLSMQVYALVDGWFGPEWRWADIAELYSPWTWQPPVFKINPGDVLNVRATFAPSAAGGFQDEIVLTTSIGEYRIPTKGIGIDPPSIQVDTTPVEVSMNSAIESTSHAIMFDNLNGLSPLEYTISIDFGRIAANSKERMGARTTGVAPMNSVVAAKKSIAARPLSTYNKTVSHTEQTDPDTFIGTGGSAPFTLATKFNAGEGGLNLSHIETFFRTESLTTGTIDVEVRAGGTSIANAYVVNKGTLTFSGNGSDEAGSWHQIALDNVSQIFPNEDFYVLLTYPFGIEFPQGSFYNSPKVSGRFLYYDEGSWYDLQEDSEFAATGWLMFAAEMTAGNGTWVTVTSATQGQLQPGEASSVNLLLTGAVATPGDQIAEIVFKSNDTKQAEVRVPVKLHLNDAPRFSSVPEKVIISENEVKTIAIMVNDAEGNTFEVLPSVPYEHVTMSLTEGIISVELSPDFEASGTYQYVFRAIDQYNATREFVLNVEVLPTNRAPVFVGTSTSLAFDVTQEMVEIPFADFFSDPDLDHLDHSVVSQSEEIAVVFASPSKFLVQPLSVGETTLTFTVMDVHGAILTQNIALTVNIVLGLESITSLLEAYPNPATSAVVVELPSSWNGKARIELLDALGRQTINMNAEVHSGKAVIDLTSSSPGVYILRATNGTDVRIKRIIKK